MLVDWIHLAQDRGDWQAVMNTAMNLRVPYNVGYLLDNSATIVFSIRIPKF
jgi:hypothetical protein